ncbi:hypothetical protein TCAL_13016 [Tigriopus californicus]|uniref:Apple domain-containing protein n=1 Tax=Tigriopus californicus TaxID=6832 RepID=A0A553N7V5_TIGCA|nr:hypothetical protein TCAL_13016 [Tigriopus californicus]|eukprot:TCALIF_13016-PA protein Name:"Protein of unknown function" AED:0.07 eAED:0.07 QI:398/1/0.5/1/1/0.5/2/0/121
MDINILHKVSLVLAFVMSLLLSHAHSFVIFDRTASCVRQFGCSADLVGWITEVEDIDTCQKMCDAQESCNYFTWHEGSGTPSRLFRHFCFFFSECGDLDFECTSCYSGPKTSGCPLRRRNL